MRRWVDTEPGIQGAGARLRDAPVVGFDTEFMRGGHFHPEPCLMQLAGPEGTDVIDLTAAISFDSLWAGFASEAKVFVVHACSEDLEILSLLGLPIPMGLFDTQVAASLAGLGFNLGLQALVQRITGETLHKDATRTDWRQRPLTDEQLAYAAADVETLLVLHTHLQDALCRQGKLEWFREEMDSIREKAAADPIDDQAYLRLRNAWRLDPRAQYLLQALVVWREQRARSLNLPRKRVCDDEGLVAIAQSRPRSRNYLLRQCQLPMQGGDALIREVLALVAEYDDLPVPDDFQAIEPPLPRESKELVESVKRVIAEAAERHRVPEGLLANRAAIESAARWLLAPDAARHPPGLLRGWRGEVLREGLSTLMREHNRSPRDE